METSKPFEQVRSVSMNVEPMRLENLVILFTDIHEFSWVVRELSESGRLWSPFLQAVYEALGDAVVGHGGEILSYHGDGMLCVFPAGAESEAIQCGLDMRAAYAAVVRGWQLAHETDLEVGIGAGEIEHGLIGHRSLRQKDILGDEVFRAARIGHHRGVAITESVYEAIKDAYPTRRLQDIHIVLHDEPLKVWEVVERA
jgi:class 3 adenylate cyclase